MFQLPEHLMGVGDFTVDNAAHGISKSWEIIIGGLHYHPTADSHPCVHRAFIVVHPGVPHS
jgi:hypothetical protein